MAFLYSPHTPHVCAKVLLKSNHKNDSSSYCFLDVRPVFVFVPNYALITLLRNTNSPDITFSRSRWCNNPLTPYSWVPMWHWWRNYSQKEVICGQLIPVLHLLTICGQLFVVCTVFCFLFLTARLICSLQLLRSSTKVLLRQKQAVNKFQVWNDAANFSSGG